MDRKRFIKGALAAAAMAAALGLGSCQFEPENNEAQGVYGPPPAESAGQASSQPPEGG